MPDLLTHALIASPLKARFPRLFSVFLLGVILPDVLSRTPGILFPGSTSIIFLNYFLHSPIIIVLSCLVLAYCFPQKIRKNFLYLLLAGSFLHLFLDLFQKTLTTGYLWFFPFSFSSFSIPLFWPDDSLFALPFLIIINIMLIKRKHVS